MQINVKKIPEPPPLKLYDQPDGLYIGGGTNQLVLKVGDRVTIISPGGVADSAVLAMNFIYSYVPVKTLNIEI